MSFEGKTFVVTGSSSGIGRALSDRLLSRGGRVVGLARRAEIKSEEGYRGISIDLGELDLAGLQLTKLASEIGPIDGVVSNAGAGFFGGLESFSPQQIRSAVDLNLTSHLLVARSFLPLLKTQGRGDFIFMGSEAALQGRRQGSLYCAAKFGLRGAAQALREECSRRGVRVSIVNPGMVRTPFFEEVHFEPGGAADEAIEIEDVVEAICSILQARPGTVIEEINLMPQKRVFSRK